MPMARRSDFRVVETAAVASSKRESRPRVRGASVHFAGSCPLNLLWSNRRPIDRSRNIRIRNSNRFRS